MAALAEARHMRKHPTKVALSSSFVGDVVSLTEKVAVQQHSRRRNLDALKAMATFHLLPNMAHDAGTASCNRGISK